MRSRRIQTYPAAALRWKLNERAFPFVNGGSMGAAGNLVNPGSGAQVTPAQRSILTRGAAFKGPDGTNRHGAYSALPTAVVAGSVLTISAWVIPYGLNGNAIVAGKAYDSNLANWATPFYSWALGLDTTGNIVFQLTTGAAGAGTRTVVTSTAATVPLAVPSLIAGVYDGTTMSTYLNGILNVSLQGKTGVIDNSTTNANFGGHYWVGCVPSTNAGVNNVGFAGLIEEVVVETGAPNPDQLRGRYFQGLGLFEADAV